MGGRNTAIEIIDHFSGMFDFSLSENKIMKEPHNDWFPGFDKQLTVLSFGMVKDLEKCIQCGKCTAQCPAAKLSPYNPRKIINDIRTGNIGKVISSEELWLCFFCSGCYAVCPNDINFPFAVTMLRYAALAKGYGWDEVRKIKDPYAADYLSRGLSVSDKERNPGIQKAIAKNSGTNGEIGSIRIKMGMPEKREVSEKAISEIQFISDVTGMTDLFRDFKNKKDMKKSWNYGGPGDFVRIKKGPNRKFAGVEEIDGGER